jgi:hypothetical protein
MRRRNAKGDAAEIALEMEEGLDSVELAARYVEVDPSFVEVLAGPFREIVPWLEKKGFRLMAVMIDLQGIVMIHPKKKVGVQITPAFGGDVTYDVKTLAGTKRGKTRITIKAVVEAGFKDI